MEVFNPLFSIIIPVYNAGNNLVKTIESVIAQSFSKWELILIDDCSKDNSWEIIQRYSKLFPQISGLKLAENSGGAKIPSDIGVSMSKGKYCLIMGHDDLLADNYLYYLSQRILETNADVVLSRCSIRDYGSKEILSMLPKIGVDTSCVYSGKDACLMTMTSWDICCNGMAFKQGLYDYVVKENTSCYMNSDELSSRIILLHGEKVAFSAGEYIYWQLPSSITHKKSIKLFEGLYTDIQLITLSQKYFDEEMAQRMYLKFLCHLIVMQKSYFREKRDYSNTERITIEGILGTCFIAAKCNRHYCNSISTYVYSSNQTIFKLCCKLRSYS